MATATKEKGKRGGEGGNGRKPFMGSDALAIVEESREETEECEDCRTPTPIAELKAHDGRCQHCAVEAAADAAAALRAKPSPAKGRLADPAEVPMRSAKSVALLDVARNRFNPRSDFDQAELLELAASLKALGQLQPIEVRRAPSDRFLASIIDPSQRALYEVVYGERRLLAAQRAGWERIDALLIEADDAEACRRAIEENRQRKQISQVEFACGLKQRMELAGFGVRELAKEQGLGESTVRNLLRLLDAPKEWQERVVKGQMQGYHLRAALPLLKHAPIAEALTKRVEKETAESGSLPAEGEWEEMLEDLTRETTAELKKWVQCNQPYKSSQLKLDKTHPRWEELGVIEVKKRHWEGAGTEPRATNKKLAKELLAEKAKAWHAKNGPKKGDESKASKARQRDKAVRELQDHERELACWAARWLAAIIGEALPLSDEWCTRIVLAAHEHSWPIDPYFDPRARGREIQSFGPTVMLKQQMLATARKAIEPENFRPYGIERKAPPLAVIAKGLGIEPKKAWTAKLPDGKQALAGELTADLWELLTEEELVDVASEWKLAQPGTDANRKALLALITRSREERILPLPSIVVEHLPRAAKAKAKKKGTKK